MTARKATERRYFLECFPEKAAYPGTRERPKSG